MDSHVVNIGDDKATSLTDKEIATFSKLFQEIDVHKKGLISKSQFVTVIELLGFYDEIADQINDLFYRQAILNGDKLLSKKEFLKLMNVIKQNRIKEKKVATRRQSYGMSGAVVSKILDNLATPTATGPSFFSQKRPESPTERENYSPVEEGLSRKISTAISKSMNYSRGKLNDPQGNQNNSGGKLILGSRDELLDVQSENSDYEYFDEEEERRGLLSPSAMQSASSMNELAKKEASISIDNFGIVDGAGQKPAKQKNIIEDAIIMDEEIVEKEVKLYEQKKAQRKAAGLEPIDTDVKVKRRQTQNQKSPGLMIDNPKRNVPAILYDPKVRKQLANQKFYTPWFLRLNLLVLVGMMIFEFIANGGIASMDVNPMIGPEPDIVLGLGAKHVPCMIQIKNPPKEINCTLNYVQNKVYSGSVKKDPVTGRCDYFQYLQEACGMGGFVGGDPKTPNQWWRFITPMFLHSGVVHLVINSFGIIKTGFPMEEQMGFIRMFFLYFLSGIGGNLFSALVRQSNITVGASGAVYGLYGVLYLDLFFNWPMLSTPWKDCLMLTVQVILALGIGLLPYIDNFAHVGGFVTGLFAGSLFLPKIYYSKADRIRKTIFLFVSIPVLFGLFTYGFVNFYSSFGSAECPWCIYIDCIPPNSDWCKNERL